MSEVGSHLVVVGTIFQTPTADRLEVLNDVVVSVDRDGVIVEVLAASSVEGQTAIASATSVRRMTSTARLLPGLIDTHVHAPQWPQLGSGLDLPLEHWLFENTFPLEARYADGDFAQRVWDDLVPCLLSWNHDRRVLLLDSRRGNAPVSKNLCRNWSTRFRRTSGHGPSRGHTSLVPRYQRS